MPSAKIKILLKSSDAIIKLAAPKVVTAGVNVARMGPRIILRSTVELLRANLLTRIISCITILVFDIVDLSRRRISKTQFTVNVLLSLLMVVGGTIGWNFGGQWIVFELLGSMADIVGGMIGAGLVVFLSSFVFGKACDKLIESDAKKMWKIIDPYIEKLPKDEQKPVRDCITAACLKRMYACEDRQVFAAELVDVLYQAYLDEAAREDAKNEGLVA
ncbi:MAG: hypothetical protein FWG38_02950 [Defluviitaleaceae bacterium]|nr:hypothetical protein [Defluviitaleaceae bacterium]